MEVELRLELQGDPNVLLLQSHVRLLHAVDLFSNELHFANLSRD
jgi:hypothetical protein